MIQFGKCRFMVLREVHLQARFNATHICFREAALARDKGPPGWAEGNAGVHHNCALGYMSSSCPQGAKVICKVYCMLGKHFMLIYTPSPALTSFLVQDYHWVPATYKYEARLRRPLHPLLNSAAPLPLLLFNLINLRQTDHFSSGRGNACWFSDNMARAQNHFRKTNTHWCF